MIGTKCATEENNVTGHDLQELNCDVCGSAINKCQARGEYCWHAHNMAVFCAIVSVVCISLFSTCCFLATPAVLGPFPNRFVEQQEIMHF